MFELIAEQGAVESDEMYAVFNMGLGFVVVVPDADADAAVDQLAARHPGSKRIGRVTAAAGEVARA